MLIRRAISWVTVASLTASFTITGIWFLASTGRGRFEPAVTGLSIVAAVIGIFAERAASRRELVDLAIWSIREELRVNARILQDHRFAKSDDDDELYPRVFPRLLVAAVETAMSSGSIQALTDPGLLKELQIWQDTVHEFNRRLDLTELRTLGAVGSGPEELKALDAALHRRNGYLEVLQRQLGELRQHPLLTDD
jgi:hypothetical protein